MAFRNGLLIHGPTHWSLAARGNDGTIEVGSGPKPSFTPGGLGDTPMVRGPLKLAEAFAVIPLARIKVRSARLPFENPRVIAGSLASMGFGNLIQRYGRAGVARESAASILGLLPATIALQDRTLASYHGVEHKAIGAYEKGSLDPRTAPKEHERCGSNLIAPMMIFSVAGQVLVDTLFEKPGQIHRAVAGLGSMSLAVELFAHAERSPDSPAAKTMRYVGHEIQRLISTAEPSEEQIEVGQAALMEILRVEGAEAPVA
jgi:uncharacterized protein YqhQ